MNIAILFDFEEDVIDADFQKSAMCINSAIRNINFDHNVYIASAPATNYLTRITAKQCNREIHEFDNSILYDTIIVIAGGNITLDNLADSEFKEVKFFQDTGGLAGKSEMEYSLDSYNHETIYKSL